MQVKSISLHLTMYFTISPFHTVIPVNCRKITGKTLLVNSKLHYWLHLFTSEAPFTHQFQIINHFGHIITQKWPLSSCASQCCICKHRMVYAVSVFIDVFIFVKCSHSWSDFGPDTSYQATSNRTTQHSVNASSTSELLCLAQSC